MQENDQPLACIATSAFAQQDRSVVAVVTFATNSIILEVHGLLHILLNEVSPD